MCSSSQVSSQNILESELYLPVICNFWDLWDNRHGRKWSKIIVSSILLLYILSSKRYSSQCQIDWLAGERNQTAVFSIIRYAQLYSETLTWKCHKAIQMFVHFLITFTKLSWIWSSLAQSLLDKQFLLENWRFTFWVAGLFSRYLWLDGWWTDRLTTLLWWNLRHTLSAEIACFSDLKGTHDKDFVRFNTWSWKRDSFWEIFWWTLFMVVFHILSQGCTIFFKQTCAVENRDTWPLAVQKETYAIGLWVRRTGWQGNLSRMNGFTRTWVVTKLWWWWWQWYKY